MQHIIVGGGCFWGVERYFQQLKGVVKTDVGYANGNIENPSYNDVCDGRATHVEACRVFYNEEEITLENLLEHLFRFIDPTSLNRQGGDVGIQYRTGVYFEDESDEIIIKQFIKKQQQFYTKPIVVEVEQLANYYLAEEYHQDYLIKNPSGYCHVDFRLINADEKK